MVAAALAQVASAAHCLGLGSGGTLMVGAAATTAI